MKKSIIYDKKKMVAITISLALVVTLTLVVAGVIIPEIFWGLVLIAWFVAYRYYPKNKVSRKK